MKLDVVLKHARLDDAITPHRAPFLSDWNGQHPYVDDFLGPDLAATGLITNEHGRYLYFDEEHEIIDAIRHLHRAHEGIELSRANVLAGSGSSSLLVALCLWLLRQKYAEVCYVPPLYYTLHYFLDMLDVSLRPVTARHLFEADATMDLPSDKTALLVCDPVWFAGCRVPSQAIETIGRWQRATGSVVIVDGSFQFMQWDRTRKEHSSALDPELTFRLISPTKSLAIPFFRFAYLLHPAWAHRELLFIYENMVGGSTVADVVFARRALKVLAGDSCNYALTDHLRRTFESLVRRDLIRTSIGPDCGYFVFAQPRIDLLSQVTMGQEYFELEGYPDHIRINLMVAHQLLSTD